MKNRLICLGLIFLGHYIKKYIIKIGAKYE